MNSQMVSDDKYVPTVEARFTGRSGAVITIQRYGTDDYDATWNDEFSVRGTFMQILDEIRQELPAEHSEQENLEKKLISFGYKQWEEQMMDNAKETPVFFEHNGQEIVTPFMSPDGRFELTAEAAVATYGLDKFFAWCKQAEKHI